MKRHSLLSLLHNLLLVIIAVIMFGIFVPFGFVAMIVVVLVKFSPSRLIAVLSQTLLRVAISIDQLGNVLCAELFNVILITTSDNQFGNEDETISSVIGKNKVSGTLTRFGGFIERFLHLLDPNHSVESIEK